jgi:DNA-binding transcriptional LysR family regulator
MLHGSVSRAAEASGSSQPTLSRELARLEQLLGFSLFDRVRGRLRPTVRAMALLQEVERSFIGIAQIAAHAQMLRLQTTERLRLACLPALAHSLAPRVVHHLQRLAPNLPVCVTPLESPWLEQAMSEQRFDAGLSEVDKAPVGVRLQRLLLVNEVAVLPAGHRLGHQAVLTPQDFAGERFISLAPDDRYRSAIDAMFAQAGVERLLVLETASAVAICAMVLQGLGVAIVNPLTAQALSGPFNTLPNAAFNGSSNASSNVPSNSAAPQGASLWVRPLSVEIPFQVSLLLPEISAPHPALESVIQAMEWAAADCTAATCAKA